ncbi:MAG TPA: tetratricopeptide repeat protein, partial [Bacteroidetes bacterium]|nr:tetratricopeptide repeat protein [Bacteroidota bacterium]
EQAVSADSSDFENMTQLANLYFEKGDSTRAMELYQKLQQSHPDDWRSYYNLGQFFYRKGDLPGSITYLRKAADLNGNIPLLWLLLGENYFRLDSLDQAVETLKKAHRMVPDDRNANYLLGLVLSSMGNSRDAAPYFEKTLRIDSTDVNAMSLLASIYSDMGNYELSDSLYERALQLKPDNPVIQNNYSYSLAVRGVQLERALELVNAALEKDPENGAFLDTKGWILYKLGRQQEAEQLILHSLRIRDTSAEVWEHLGDIYQAMGKADKAREAWQKALELDAERESVQIKLGKKVE